MKKRGQFIANLFKYILIAIIAVSIIFFGVKGINKVRSASRETEIILFKNNLKKSVEGVSGEVGSISGESFNVPAGIEKIYFIDLEEEIDEDIENESKLIYDSLVSGVEKNVFFMKNGKIIDSIYIPELKLRYPYYRCFETFQTGRMALYLGGYGSGTNVEHVNHFYNCGYIPVLMENESLNDEVKTRVEDGTTVSFPADYKDRIEDTKENVFLGRKVDIKKDGTNIKIRIKPFDKIAEDFIYVEDIPKECINDLANYLELDAFGNPLIRNLFLSGNRDRSFGWVFDPIIVWHFGEDEQITDKQEIEYDLTEQIDCMRLINALGFGGVS